MADGKVRREGPLAEVLADVKMPIETENGASVVLSGKVSSLSSEWKTCCIDAGGWTFETPMASLAMGSQVRLRVLAREIAAHLSEPAYQLVKLKCPNGEGRLVSRILNQSVTELGLHPGSQVWALVKASAVIM